MNFLLCVIFGAQTPALRFAELHNIDHNTSSYFQHSSDWQTLIWAVMFFFLYVNLGTDFLFITPYPIASDLLKRFQA